MLLNKEAAELSLSHAQGNRWQDSGAPNDGFLPNALKRCFRLSGGLLKLCRLILGCAIKFLSVPLVFLGELYLLGLFCPFPENLRSYFLSENPS